MADLVPNPRHQRLQVALQTVQGEVGAITSALAQASGRMNREEVWIGPTARAFAADLTGELKRLQRQLDHLLTDIEKQLQATPPHVPRTDLWRWQ